MTILNAMRLGNCWNIPIFISSIWAAIVNKLISEFLKRSICELVLVNCDLITYATR